MADDLNVQPAGGGTVVPVRADNVGGVLFQIIKLAFGGDGAATDVTTSNGLPVQSAAVGDVADPAYSGSGNGSVVALLKKLVAQFTAGFNMTGSIAMSDAEGIKGQFGGVTANPSNSFTRPNDSLPYVANDIIANSTTNTAIAYNPITVGRIAGGSFQIDRLRLSVNTTSSATIGGTTMKVRLWSQQPTYNNGDNGLYSVLTGAAGYLGSFTGTWEQFADGAVCIMTPDFGSPCVKLASGQTIWWDLQTLDAWTPQNSRVFTLTAEVKQD